MQLTKQQKMVGAVLGLAVAAFAVDRWVIGHAPADDAAMTASAAAAPAARRTAPRPQRNRVPAADQMADASQAGVATLAARLDEVARTQKLNLEVVNDAFRPPAAWVGTQRTAMVEDRPDAARDFLQRHRLTAVMRQTGGGVAIIDQKTVAVGQSLDGFRLVAVKERSAVLRRGQHRVELRLPEDVLQGGAAPSEKVVGLDASR
jgi:hypothetical protein